MTSHITVVLPVRNGRLWLLECLDSLKAQTYSDFETILIDDGSTDGSAEFARAYGLPGLRILPGPRQGLAAALALGVNAATGEFIVRQDQDDVSEPTRIERQVAFMRSHPEHVACGSGALTIDASGDVSGRLAPPLHHPALALRMCTMNPFVHSSMILRRLPVIGVGNYWCPSPTPFPEDYHLWSRLCRTGLMANLPEPLVRYRIGAGGVSATHAEALANAAGSIAVDHLRWWLGADLLRDDVQLVRLFNARNRRISIAEALALESLLVKARAKAGWIGTRGGFTPMTYVKPWAWTVISQSHP